MTDEDPTLSARVRRGLRNLRAGPGTWVVLLGNRLVLAALVTAVFGALVVAATRLGVVDVDGQTQLLYLFQGLVTGNLTLLTIVLSINQLILSREFNTPGELEERIGGAERYREGVRETVDVASLPVRPSPFLNDLLDATRDAAEAVERLADDVGDTELAAELRELCAPIAERVSESSRRLEDSAASPFAAIVVVLETNYSQPLADARGLRRRRGDDLPPGGDERLDALILALRQVDVARQYFKSIYMQSELARLSQLLLWVGVPAIGSAGVMLFVYAGGPSTSVPPPTVRALVVPVLVLGFVPLAVLFAFVLRIAAVAQRTVSITPFTTTPQEEIIEEE